MERLTGKDNKKYTLKAKSQCGGPDFFSAIQKLGPLEDIEEELGIDLATLLTSKHIYYKLYCSGEKLSKTYESYAFDIDFNSKTINIYVCEDATPYVYTFSEYGKTWALTKEELE